VHSFLWNRYSKVKSSRVEEKRWRESGWTGKWTRAGVRSGRRLTARLLTHPCRSLTLTPTIKHDLAPAVISGGRSQLLETLVKESAQTSLNFEHSSPSSPARPQLVRRPTLRTQALVSSVGPCLHRLRHVAPASVRRGHCDLSHPSPLVTEHGIWPTVAHWHVEYLTCGDGEGRWGDGAMGRWGDGARVKAKADGRSGTTVSLRYGMVYSNINFIPLNHPAPKPWFGGRHGPPDCKPPPRTRLGQTNHP